MLPITTGAQSCPRSHSTDRFPMDKMIEVARNSVQTWETDQMGHMNVQFYMEKASHGLAALGLHLGMAPNSGPCYGKLIASNHHVRFLREQRPGAPFLIRAGILDMGEDSLTVYQEMISTTSGEVAATFTGDAVLLDTRTQQPRTLPDSARDEAQALLMAQPTHGQPRGLQLYRPRPSPTLQEADTLGMLPTHQCEIQAAQCDPEGHLLARHYMGIVSDAIPNLLAQMQGDREASAPDVGGAALEYRFIYRDRPRAGDVLALRSGLRAVTGKTYLWCHWLFDLATGTAVATAEAVAVALDLKARKVIPIPEAVRSRLAGMAVDALSV